MVAHDPGDWFEDALRAVGGQEYPNIRVLVVDAGSQREQDVRVHRVLPDAQVIRLEGNPGYGAAVNRVSDQFGEAAFLVLAHDDVRPDPNAVQLMVEETFRSNAGVAGPKLVDWSDASRLLAVGTSVDKTGVPAPYVDRGELDQQQHDAVRDVFALPGAFTLIRTDLFTAIGGFDEGIDYLGDDIDLCWRAHVAGARVLVVPPARVAHLEALGQRRPHDDRRRLQARHRLRTIASCYGRANRVRVLPQAAVYALIEVVYAIVVGHMHQARDVASAWPWNFRRWGEVRAKRKGLAKLRRVSDRELRRLQVRGSARFSAFLRGQIGKGDDPITGIAGVGRQLAGSLRESAVRTVVLVWLGVFLVLLVGTRDLLLDSVPTIGQFGPFPDHATDLMREWFSGYRSAGLGSETPAPTAFGFLGGFGYVFLGAMGVLRQVLILGLLPLGAIGAWRLLKPCASRRGRLVGLLVYVAIPVGYNALAEGHWSGLVIYGLAPWIVGHLARASGAAPWGDVGGPAGPGAPERTVAQRVLAFALLLALACLLVPVSVVLVVVVALAVVVGSVLAGQVAGSVRMVSVALLAGAVAVVLHFPWSLDLLSGQWQAIAGARTAEAGPLSLGQILRFDTGPLGSAPLGWAFLAVGAFALLAGKEWRLAWAIRGWTIALACWGLLWIGQEGWLPFGLPQAEVVLAPAAVGLALAAAMGMVAFEVDLRDYHFGWRQLAAIVSAAALVLAALPVIGDALVDGRWGTPSRDYDTTLGVLGEDAPGGFRMLWLGDSDALPLAGWELVDGVAYATSDDGVPDVQDQWAGPESGATERLGDALRAALEGDTNRLGSQLGTMGVQYVVVPLQQAPDAERRFTPAPAVTEALEDQLDLARLDLTGSLIVYRNDAYVPVPASVAVGDGGDPGEAARLADPGSLSAAEPVLDPSRFARFTGDVDEQSVLYLASDYSSRWTLTVDGDEQPHRRAFEWANGYGVERSGSAVLAYETPLTRYGMLALQALLWLVVLVLVIRARAEPEEEAS
jgi:GT2 family glycosyltransferase